MMREAEERKQKEKGGEYQSSIDFKFMAVYAEMERQLRVKEQADAPN